MKEKLINYWKEDILGEEKKEVDKEKSLISLILWTLFIIIVCFIVFFGRKTTEENIVNFVSLDEIFSKYTDYNYKVTVKGSNIYNFDGNVVDGINSGTFTNLDSNINYKIISNSAINEENAEPIDLDILFYYFYLDNIFESVRVGELISEKIEDNTKLYVYNCVYNGEDITFKILTGVDNISEITYTYGSVDYVYTLD